MPLAQRTAAVGLALSAALLVVVGLLLVWLWHERRRRDPEVSAEDAAHFARQDRRRAAVLVILGIIAVGVLYGSRLDPRAGARARAMFMQVWVGILLLLSLLPVLAVVDWLATRRYARRHLHALARERMEILQDELRLRASRRGKPDDPSGPLGDSAAT